MCYWNIPRESTRKFICGIQTSFLEIISHIKSCISSQLNLETRKYKKLCREISTHLCKMYLFKRYGKDNTIVFMLEMSDTTITNQNSWYRKKCALYHFANIHDNYSFIPSDNINLVVITIYETTIRIWTIPARERKRSRIARIDRVCDVLIDQRWIPPNERWKNNTDTYVNACQRYYFLFYIATSIHWRVYSHLRS